MYSTVNSGSAIVVCVDDLGVAISSDSGVEGSLEKFVPEEDDKSRINC